MATTKKLYMEWELDNGKTHTVSIPDPKTTLTANDVRPVMQQAVTNDLFRVGTAGVTTITDAYVREITDSVLIAKS